MAILVDTGALLALEDSSDRWHETIRRLFETIREPLLVTAPVLTEACHLLTREFGASAARELVLDVQEGKFEFVPLVREDLGRAYRIMARYSDARLDFADATLTAVAERLKITRIATTDRRDFSLVRPAHCDKFELLP